MSRSNLLSLLLISSLLFSSFSIRIELKTADHKEEDTPQSSFLSAYTSQTLGTINSNPFLIYAYQGAQTLVMGLSLYQSDTVLSNYCSAFNNAVFSCSYGCTTSFASPSNYLYFTSASANYVSLNYPITFAGNSWTSSYSYTKTVASCGGTTFPATSGTGFVGMIGLGLGNSYYLNTTGNLTYNTFTVSLSGTTYGTLALGNDTDFNSGFSYTITGGVTSDWRFSLSYISIGGSTYSSVSNAMFDLNMPYILVPSSAYTQFLSYLYNTYGFYCSTGYYLSGGYAQECYFVSTSSYSSISSLPNFYVSPSYGSSFSISPSNYLTYSYGYYYILLAPTSSTSNGNYYVSSLFTNSVILGKPFLQYYNVQFNFSGTSPQITLWTGSLGVLGLALTIVLIIIFGSLFGCCCLIIILGYCCCRASMSQYRMFRFMGNGTQKTVIIRDQYNPPMYGNQFGQPAYNTNFQHHEHHQHNNIQPAFTGNGQYGEQPVFQQHHHHHNNF